MKSRIPKKEKVVRVARAPKKHTMSLSGASQFFMAGVVLTLFLTAGMYLYSVNRNAVQGYHLRTLEKRIATLSEKNAELQIAEADMRSFYRINASKDELEMEKAEQVKYLEPPKDTVALR